MVLIHPRSEWTSRVPNWQPARRGVPDAFIHHEGGAVRGVPSNKAAVLREIEAGVLKKGYIAIDYSLCVFNDGDIWEGRGLAHEDGATINNNATSVSIVGIGNYEKEPAPDALVNGIAAAVQYAGLSGWAAPKPNIRPHRDVFSTACPGANLYARMGDIRARAAGNVGDDDLTPDQAAQLNETALRVAALEDKIGWLCAWIKDGGYPARSDGKPSRVESILAGVNKLLAK